MGFDDGREAAVADERERCAQLCTMRADISRASAAKLRRDGTYTTWFGVTRVRPTMGNAARDLDEVARAFVVVADCIRKGYDPRKLEVNPDEKINL